MLNLNYNSLISKLTGPAPTKTIDFLVAAAGGLGGNNNDANGRSGGGGAGGLITGSVILEPNKPYTFTIGVGQNGITGQGFSSSLITSTGVTYNVDGGTKGNDLDVGGTSGTPNSFAGGTSAGGGGGATAVGTNGILSPTPTKGGDGGAGVTWLDGNGYSGGGYGLIYLIGPGTPLTGSFGAPSGSVGNGGGAGRVGAFNRIAPGNGVGVVRYQGTPRGTGGQIVYNNLQDYTYHYFTASGAFIL
jgi:hypothetical protein